MIVAIYGITAAHPLGPKFWDQAMFSLMPQAVREIVGPLLANVDKAFGLRGLWSLQGIPVNIAFMLFGGVGTLGNIVNRSV